MSFARLVRSLWIVLPLLLALAALSLAPQPAAPGAPAAGNAIALKPPPFVQPAYAQEGTDTATAADDAAAPLGFPQDEAGISAYFKSASPVTLADVRSLFRIIEVETANYIIGSVPVPDYEERYDVHVYIHRDGWFLAYYLSADPVSKIIDWRSYSTSQIPTLLEHVLQIVASTAGVPFARADYYDFRYPNATHMMLVAEDPNNGSDFQINLPGSYVYNERSWSAYWGWCCGYVCFVLDGVQIGCHDPGFGFLTAAQLLPDRQHTINIGSSLNGNIGLALIYRVP